MCCFISQDHWLLQKAVEGPKFWFQIPVVGSMLWYRRRPLASPLFFFFFFIPPLMSYDLIVINNKEGKHNLFSFKSENSTADSGSKNLRQAPPPLGERLMLWSLLGDRLMSNLAAVASTSWMHLFLSEPDPHSCKRQGRLSRLYKNHWRHISAISGLSHWRHIELDRWRSHIWMNWRGKNLLLFKRTSCNQQI